MNAPLPQWNLNDLYGSVTDPAMKRDQEQITQQITQFTDAYRGKINTAAGVVIYEGIQRYEQLQDRLGKLSSYGDLLFATASATPEVVACYQNVSEYVSEQASALVFFTLELNLLPEEQLRTAYESHPPLLNYEPWLRDSRAFRPHQLEESLERLMLDKSITSEAAWVRLYEEVSNRLKVTIDGTSLSLTEALDLLSHTDSGKREAAAKALGALFTEQADQFGFILNIIMKDKAIEDKWRGFSRPVSSRNLSNFVEDTIVDTLTESVTAQYPALSERYYRLKARLFGKDTLDYWDRNAPLPDDQDKPITWDEAKGMVLGAYRQFSPQMAEIAEQFFTRNWIDAPVAPGKTSGAFSHPAVPSVHPYILMNYQGKVRDVMTLAHELGHGIHQVLSAKQGALMADTPLTLAETASVFGEQLTFQYLLKHEEEKGSRIRLIAGKVEDMLNTVVRQVAFYRFETAVHTARLQGELSAEDIAAHWMRTQKESFGDAIRLDDNYRHYWTYISHFYHAPFYVYAYAFGDCLVNSLYVIYEEERTAGRAGGFEARYLDMLRSGGRLRHKELLAPFGIDIAQPDFWNKGLSHISRLIDQLEREL